MLPQTLSLSARVWLVVCVRVLGVRAESSVLLFVLGPNPKKQVAHIIIHLRPPNKGI